MKLKVTVMGSNWGYYEIDDYREYYNDICNEIGEEKANKYFSCGFFDMNWMKKHNGEHFLYGWFEDLMQSERCPYYLFNENEKLQFQVEMVN